MPYFMPMLIYCSLVLAIRYLRVIHVFRRDRDWLQDEPAAAAHVEIPAVVEALNKPIVVSQHYSTDTSGVKVNVIRDDYLVGGSKQRALDVFMHEGADEYVAYRGDVTCSSRAWTWGVNCCVGAVTVL